MKQKLEIEYDITVDNMIPLTKKDETSEFKIEESSFYSVKSGKIKKIKILVSENSNKQIFKMNDGKFILEVEDYDEIDEEGPLNYFYSTNINDLIN